MITAAVVKQTYQESMISIINLAYVHGLVHSTLDANRWQLHAVQPHANAFKKASNPKISGNKVKDTREEAPTKAKGQLYFYLLVPLRRS